MYQSMFCYPYEVLVQNWALCKLQAFQNVMDTVRVFVGRVLTEENYIFQVCMFMRRVVPKSKKFHSVFSP